MTQREIQVVDLFAGPGGLAEGFSSFSTSELSFRIALSVEKDPFAVQTLLLRSHFRSFGARAVPDAYYDYVQGRSGLSLSGYLERHGSADDASDVVFGALGTDAIDRAVDRSISRIARQTSDWILVGGPPCQAYSLIGRSRMQNADPKRFRRDHRHRLYLEYLRVLAKFEPPMFLMENVPGVLSSKLGQEIAFDRIRADLSDPQLAAFGRKSHRHYNVVPLHPPHTAIAGQSPSKAYVVRAEDFGVPQARHRVFLLGIRSDIHSGSGLWPMLESKAESSVAQVLAGLHPLRSRLSTGDDFGEWRDVVQEAARYCRSVGVGGEKISEILARSWLRSDPGVGGRFVRGGRRPSALSDWLTDDRLEGALNHHSRGHMATDLVRYLFSAAFAEKFGKSPTLADFPTRILPAHKNARSRRSTGKPFPFADRFKVQIRDAPASTVTSHISKDGHAFIHYDVSQCRSLTVREAARLQTFPDNYFFEGPRTQQFVQVGNAVPPWLARQVAEAVARALLSGNRGRTARKMSTRKAA